MEDINELTVMKEINNIENAKAKYFFFGFMASLIPYSVILVIAKKIDLSSLFINTILVFMILTSIFNAFILSSNIYQQLVRYFEDKYETSYKTIKESIK